MLTNLFYALVIGLCLSWLFKFIVKLDLNQKQFSHRPGRCLPISNIDGGSEDIELLPSGVALITSGLQYHGRKAKEIGEIFAIDLEKVASKFDADGLAPEAVKVKIQKSTSGTFDPASLKPHGITSYSAKGASLVYIISHYHEHDAIEKFTYDERKHALTHVKTIRNELFRNINDLVAVGDDQLFVSNDQYFRNDVLMIFEHLFMLDWGSLVYVDGSRATIVDSRLGGSNGVAFDVKNSRLYLSLFSKEAVRMYHIDGESHALTHELDIPVYTGVDNLWVDQANGDIWAGCHPVVHEAIPAITNPGESRAPSQVLRIRVENDHRWAITEPYADDGEQLSCSSVAVYSSRSLLIGSVYDRLLYCRVESELVI